MSKVYDVYIIFSVLLIQSLVTIRGHKLSLKIYLSIFICSITKHTATRKEQWNRTDKADSFYSCPKKRKNKNESSYNKY